MRLDFPGTQRKKQKRETQMKRTGIRLVALTVLVVAGLGVGRLAGVPDFTLAAPGPALLQGQGYVLTSMEQQATTTAASVSRSVVQVETVGVGLGLGVIATANGYIVTNDHVVSGGTSYMVTLSDGQRLPGQLVGVGQADDLAVLKVSTTGLQAARFGDSSKLTIAQDVLAIGNPLGLGETVTSGVVSAMHRTVSEGPGASYLPNALQTSAPINPGNSGGALVSLNGQVVGIPTLVASDPQIGGAAQGIGFAMPSNQVITVVNQIITNGKVTHTGRAYLGVTSTDNTGNQAQIDPLTGKPSKTTPMVQGALVQGVDAGTPAATAGL